MNIQVKYNKIHKYESVWRDSEEIRDKDYDDRGIPFPWPKPKANLSKSFQKKKKSFINRLKAFQELLDEKEMYKEYYPEKDDLITGEDMVSSKLYKLFNVHWEDGLIHYINEHNIEPSEEFQDFIFDVYIDKTDKFQIKKKKSKKEKVLRLPGIVLKVENKRFIKLTRNQLMIMDALMKDGSGQKRYYDSKGKLRYSEHSGLLDFGPSRLEKIIVNSKTNISDDQDYEILLPQNMMETFDFEFLFHTHPATPKPGGRVKEGLLYEFPSISDIFHFVDHYNQGVTQGSIVIAPEGFYMIRAYKTKLDEKILFYDEEKVYKTMLEKMFEIQDKAIEKYGKRFSTETFYKKIAKDKSFIKEFNKTLNKYKLKIDYKPRIKDRKRWILDDIFLPVSVIEPIVVRN